VRVTNTNINTAIPGNYLKKYDIARRRNLSQLFFSGLYHKLVFFGLNTWTTTSSFRQSIIFCPRPKINFRSLC
jgi:hypothetical protein